MTRWTRFWIGGSGGLLPVLASLLVVDLALIGSALAGESKPDPSGLGLQQPRRLSGPEIVSNLVGNTAHGPGRFGPNTTTIHYNRDGTIDLTSPDGRDSGTWKVTDDGLFCTKYRYLRNGAETCQTLWQTGPDTFEFHLPNGTILKGSITSGVQ